MVPTTIRLVSQVVWRLRVEGGDAFPDPPFVIAANHHSFLDPPMIGAAFGKRVRFVTLADLFGNYRLLDLALETFETIRVRRGSVPLGAVRQALEHLGDDGVVAIFPEGTRSSRFGALPFAAGAAWLAVRAQVPLVPVSISGTERVLGIDNKLRRGRVKVIVGPPLRPDGSGRPAVDRLTQRWVEWVSESLQGYAPVDASDG
ncbi:lysophospholipid acyltransferase family protein [soil metagenome]